MIAMICGVAMIGSSLALLYAAIPRGDANSKRSEWVDNLIAIAFSAGLVFGGCLLIAGVASN